jgi:hypothetical protein
MSITLSAAVGFADAVLPVSGAFPGTPASPNQVGMALIDSEQVRVRGNGSSSWLVDRGVNGTQATSHAQGATVTPLYEVASTSTPQTSPVALLAPAAQAQAQSTSVEAAFVAAGAGTYTATIPIPAGATVLDVIFRNTVLWDSGTSASMTCGDDDSATGYFTATNVKTTPSADTSGAEAGLSTRLSLGASAGAFKGGAGKYCAAAKTITCTIVAVGAGSAGRSRLLVEYAVPASAAVVKS